MLSLKNEKQASGFSVLTADELYFINGGESWPATSYPEVGKNGEYTGEQYIMPDDHSKDTVYTGENTGIGGSADLNNGTHGTYDTDTKTFTPDSKNTSSTVAKGPSGASSSGGKA